MKTQPMVFHVPEGRCFADLKLRLALTPQNIGVQLDEDVYRELVEANPEICRSLPRDTLSPALVHFWYTVARAAGEPPHEGMEQMYACPKARPDVVVH